MIQFTIPGDPVGKARPRVTRYGAYTPKKTVDYEKRVRAYFGASGAAPVADSAKALYATITAYFAVPSSYSKKKQSTLPGTPYLHKPDFDNIGKIVCDALNGIAYADDAQICDCRVSKWYTAENPRVEVKISEVAL